MTTPDQDRIGAGLQALGLEAKPSGRMGGPEGYTVPKSLLDKLTEVANSDKLVFVLGNGTIFIGTQDEADAKDS